MSRVSDTRTSEVLTFFGSEAESVRARFGRERGSARCGDCSSPIKCQFGKGTPCLFAMPLIQNFGSQRHPVLCFGSMSLVLYHRLIVELENSRNALASGSTGASALRLIGRT